MSNSDFRVLSLDASGNVVDEFGRHQPDSLPRHKVRRLEKEGGCFRLHDTVNGTTQLRHEPLEFFKSVQAEVQPIQELDNTLDLDQEEVIDFINKSITLKPAGLMIHPVKWKYLMRSVARGKNIMMTGPSGCGKTLAAQSVSKAFPERSFFYFNLGATQDPRSTLVGNTHFNNEDGTFVAEALFVKAIQTENSIILLDELTRANPDAWNILITVLDQNQRYLRIDERPDTPTINVAEGVTFIATANIGAEYTATRVLDRAITERFTAIVEMSALNLEDELSLLRSVYPDVADKTIMAIAEIADTTRRQVKSDDPQISTAISSRVTVEMAGLIFDGFSLEEAAEVCIFPFYDEAGGIDSERVFMKQLVQKYTDSGIDGDAPWEDYDEDRNDMDIPF